MSGIKARILGVATLLAVVVAVGLPALYEILLDLEPAQSVVARYCLGGFGPLATLAAALVVWRLAETRKSVLELPARLSLVFLAVEILVLTVLMTSLLLRGTRGPVLLTLMLCSSALLALPVVPLYAYARAVLLPLATRLGDETRPTGRRIPIGLQVGYTVVAVSAAALVPAALFGAAQLDHAALVEARQRAELAAQRLAHVSEKLDLASATKLVTRTPLDGGQRLILVAPSGTHLPDDIGMDLGGMAYVETPLGGPLKGGTLRVFYPARPRAHGPLLSAVLLLLWLTLWVAARASRAVSDDMVGITRQIEHIARGEQPGPVGRLSTQEVRRVAMAVNRLLERIPRLTVESFLAIERAAEAQRLKSQFLANMSHDLRSPLNSILGFSELLLRGLEGEIQPGQRVTLAAMHATGLRLLRLLNEILDTAKVESGKMELHRQQASPAELIRQAVQDARRGRPPSLTDQLMVELQPGLAPIHVDPLRLTQVATHLVNHAFDSVGSEPGKRRMVLRASQQPNPRSFVLEIEYDRASDPALWEDERDHLFDGFRLGGPRPGLHLALPLAKRLVEIHGGTLELVEPKPTEDTAIRLRAIIPVATLRRAA
jgi:signal transduction histidine kinase